ncbi:MAG: hypothetical protein ACFCUI_09345 [Bernardetiaceae bacterium]
MEKSEEQPEITENIHFDSLSEDLDVWQAYAESLEAAIGDNLMRLVGCGG